MVGNALPLLHRQLHTSSSASQPQHNKLWVWVCVGGWVVLDVGVGVGVGGECAHKLGHKQPQKGSYCSAPAHHMMAAAVLVQWML